MYFVFEPNIVPVFMFYTCFVSLYVLWSLTGAVSDRVSLRGCSALITTHVSSAILNNTNDDDVTTN